MRWRNSNHATPLALSIKLSLDMKKTRSSSKPKRRSHSASVILHPTSTKMLRKGHPWVTTDSFSKKFPQSPLFLKGRNHQQSDLTSPEFLLLNDPKHPHVKARIWSRRLPLSEEQNNFQREFRERLTQAIKLRLTQNHLKEREIIYLVFGEADFLPGLKVLWIKNGLFIQTYAGYWTRPEVQLKSNLKEALAFCELFPQWIGLQERHSSQKKKLIELEGKIPSQLKVQEFGIRYTLQFDRTYDFGFYPDMSGIRKKLKKYFQEKKQFLNLFSYTGAFSLWALSLGVQEVISVDLSQANLNWLEENKKLNPQLKGHHLSISSAVEETLDSMITSQKKFDLILSDPPSTSSDGQKKSQALREYQVILPKAFSLLKKEGLFIGFLNTHSVTRKKFEESLKKILSPLPNSKIISTISLQEDCPLLKGFPEGDYLKGVVIKKV